MKCITSPALDNVEIAMYVDGEADEAVIAHIQQCPFCSDRARQWTLLQNRLKKQFYRVNCPTPMDLGDYHLDYLPDPQRLIVAQHVRECVLCRRDLAELESFLANLAPESSLLDTAKVLVARSIGGQTENRFAPALRGEAKEPLILEADGVVIILGIQTINEGKVNILGQVAAENQDQWTEALVELRQDGQLEFSSRVDDLGAFQAEGIIPGLKELQIISEDHSLIVISNFEVPT